MSWGRRTTFIGLFAVISVGSVAGAVAARRVAAPQNATLTSSVATEMFPLPALDRLVSRLASEARTHGR